MLASSSQRLVRVSQRGVGHRLASAWSGSLSFASPEADFSAGSSSSSSPSNERYFVTSSSPSATATTNKQHHHHHHHHPYLFYTSYTTAAHLHPQENQISWSNTLTFTSPESDFTSPETARTWIQQTKRYPETLAEALRSNLACVVTRPNAPHTIVSVNDAWVSLCGYTAEEVIGRSLAMIQGIQTNTSLTTATVNAVNANEWVDMYVVNYKKNGSPFTNHVSMKEVGLSRDEPDVRFLLGVLEPVDRAPLRMI